MIQYTANDRELFVKKLNNLIELHNNHCNVNYLCRELAMSRSQLYRKVLWATAKSVQKYIITYKITKAIEILLNNSYTITEVAQITGFSSIYVFSRVFKRITGLSPSDYVKMRKINKK